MTGVKTRCHTSTTKVRRPTVEGQTPIKGKAGSPTKKITVAEPRGWLDDGDLGSDSTDHSDHAARNNSWMSIHLHRGTGRLSALSGAWWKVSVGSAELTGLLAGFSSGKQFMMLRQVFSRPANFAETISAGLSVIG